MIACPRHTRRRDRGRSIPGNRPKATEPINADTFMVEPRLPQRLYTQSRGKRLGERSSSLRQGCVIFMQRTGATGSLAKTRPRFRSFQAYVFSRSIVQRHSRGLRIMAQRVGCWTVELVMSAPNEQPEVLAVYSVRFVQPDPNSLRRSVTGH